MKGIGDAARMAVVLLMAVAMLLSVNVAAATADGAPTGADVHVAQSLGERELTVVLRRVDGVPGPLRVDVVTHAGSAPGQLRMRLAPTEPSTAPTVASETTVQLGATPGAYGGTLRVERPGPHELVLHDGSSFASVPFVVPVTVMSPAEEMAYLGFAAAGLLLAVALAMGVLARRTWVAVVPAAGVVAALAVAVAAAVLSASTPAPPVPGEDVDATVAAVLDPYSVPHLPLAQVTRPPVTMQVRPERTEGGAVDLALSFTDSGSGRPVDDLLVHDSAFVHLLVVAPSRALRHVHPVRVAPGEYRVHLSDVEPGHYAVAAEVARRGSGVQLLRSPTGFDVAGSAAAEPATHIGGGREVGGTEVDVSVTGVRAGEPTTIVARFGDQADLQPWLGMVGHLIAVGPLPDPLPSTGSTAAMERAPMWAHAHAMTPRTRGMLTEQPDETVATYGPEVSFTHTFPLPGRYQVWVQAQRRYTLLTVPVLLDIVPGQVSGR